MTENYQKIVDYVSEAGERIKFKAGNINDIGIAKINLTEEDLRIERDLKKIIESFGDDFVFYSEEENDIFKRTENIWIADPISGTSNFIKGLPYYAIVISHVVKHEVVFAVIHNPSNGDLFVAEKDKGCYLNGTKVSVSDRTHKIILRESSKWQDHDLVLRIQNALTGYEIIYNAHSMGLNYCAVASGQVDGIISLTKDSFPEFAGSLIIKEAGGVFTNEKGHANISDSDRIFIGGNANMQFKLMEILNKVR